LHVDMLNRLYAGQVYKRLVATTYRSRRALAMRVTLILPDDLAKEFRIKVIEEYGNEKGALSKAVAHAIQLWLKDRDRERTARDSASRGAR